MPELIVFLISLAACIRGADWIGRSGVEIAKKKGVPNIAIGATVVALATTLPELTIATVSSFVNKDPQIALGVVIGSPLINIGLILGLFFLFSNYRPSIGHFSRSVNLFIVISFLLFVVTLNQNFGGLLSLLLIALGVLYLFLEYLINKKSASFEEKIVSRFEMILSLFDFTKERKIYFEFSLGAVLLAIGSKFLADSTVSLASSFHLNEFFLSISLLAIGSSLPELFTMINSLVYKRFSLSVGNLLGASVIDLTLGVGIGTLFQAGNIPFPNNLIAFLALITIGILCLTTLWKKVSVRLVGSLLIGISLLAFVILSLNQFI